MARRRSKGFLYSMRSAPTRKPKRRKNESAALKIVRGIGYTLAGLALLAVIVLLGIRWSSPTLGEETIEGFVEVLEILEDPEYHDEAAGEVAAARFEVEGAQVSVGLTPEALEKLRAGSRLKVVYFHAPMRNVAVLKSWEVVEASPEDPATSP